MGVSVSVFGARDKLTCVSAAGAVGGGTAAETGTSDSAEIKPAVLLVYMHVCVKVSNSWPRLTLKRRHS